MKQVLAIRVGAKKAVGHIVSKKWWPTVGGLGSEARFQVKKSACFWCHGRYHEWWVFSPKLKPIHRASIHPIHFDEFFFSSSYGQISRKHNFCRCILPWTWLGRIVKFIGIWILNPLKTSGGQPVALGGFGVWLGGYFLAWVLIDTIIHPCFKHAVSHVARVCAFGHWNPSSRTPLIMCVLLVNLTTLFVDGFGFEHDLDALWILLGSGFWTLWNQWRAASGIGGFGVWPPFLGFDWSFLLLVTSAFSRRYFVEMLVIPWWHLYPWWPFVAFCGLLWPLAVFAWWFVVQSATSMDTAVFCGICDNYGIYGGTVGLQCISNLFLVIFTPFRGFSAKFWCFGRNMIFWFGAKRISWLFRWFQFGFEFWLDHFCFSVHLAALEGAMPNLQVKKFAGEKVPCQICRKKNSRWEDAIATLPVKRFFKVRLVHHSPFGRRPWLQRYCWACVCNDIMVFHTPSRLVITL